ITALGEFELLTNYLPRPTSFQESRIQLRIMIACSPMTEDKSFRHKLHSGHKEKKWIFFGPETWIRPHYMIYVGTGNGIRSRKMTPEEWGELVVTSQSKPVPLVDD